MPLFLLEAKPLLFRYLLDAEVQRGIEENKKRKSESGGEGGRAEYESKPNPTNALRWSMYKREICDILCESHSNRREICDILWESQSHRREVCHILCESQSQSQTRDM